MPSYKADLRDARFILHEVFDAPALWARLPALAERIDAETANAILDEAAKVTGELLAPLNRSGDEEGAQWLEGRVRAEPQRRRGGRAVARRPGAYPGGLSRGLCHLC